MKGSRFEFVLDGVTYHVPGDFLHPGGFQLLEKYNRQDITEIFSGKNGHHAHSSAAYDVAKNFRLQRNKTLIDETKPLLCQVGLLGAEAYKEWVHRPVVGKARFFHSDFAEMCSKTTWWIVPLLWLPIAAYCVCRATSLGYLQTGMRFVAGMLSWQVLEYCLHRFVFHINPQSQTTIVLHFLFHGNHHKYPMDLTRLVFPPLPASIVVLLVYFFLHACFAQATALALFSGMLFGYVLYDCIHYLIHNGTLGGPLRHSHIAHHYKDYTKTYGISSPFCDLIFGTV